MPIAGYKPTKQVNKIDRPKAEPEVYKGVAIDNKRTPLKSIIAFISGSSWYTDAYYSQAINEHNDLKEIDTNQDSTYQQYRKIEKLEIRIDSPISPSYDSDNAFISVTGTGLLYPVIVPNINDYFVAEVSGNELGLLRITNVERKTHNKESVYSVDFSMVGFISDLNDIYTNLESKVISTTTFNKNRLLKGLTPLLNKEVDQQIINLNYDFGKLVKKYFALFFNVKHSSLIVPGQNYSIYDPFIVSFLFKILNTTDAKELRLIKQLPTDQDVYLKQPQFWEVMLNRDHEELRFSNKVMGQVSKRGFVSGSTAKGFTHHTADYMVYPKDPNLTTLLTDNRKITVDSADIVEVNNYNDEDANTYIETYTESIVPPASYPYIKLVTEDDNYVLSSSFYEGLDDLSLLEILVNKYLTKKSIDSGVLISLIKNYYLWGRLEQFYYGPILMILIKENIRSTY